MQGDFNDPFSSYPRIIRLHEAANREIDKLTNDRRDRKTF